MHQTFYIDIDEEIASVIDRLHKSATTDNYFVVPKHALLLQSIVNLKLIKREAEKNSKQAILVTQDEIGITMAQKAGLLVRTSTEGLEMTREMKSPGANIPDPAIQSLQRKESSVAAVPVLNQGQEIRPEGKKVRLANVGSNDFYSQASPDQSMKNTEIPRVIQPQSRPMLESMSGRTIAPKVVSDGIVKKSAPETRTEGVFGQQRNFSNDIGRSSNQTSAPEYPRKKQQEEYPSLEQAISGGSQKDQRLERMFQPAEPVKKNRENEVAVLGKKTKNAFLFFLLLCVLVLGGVAAYVLIPNAKVMVTIENQKTKIDVPINGKVENQESDLNSDIVSLKILERDESVTLEFPASGSSSSVNGQKAKGKVVISNEYNKEPQQLIATTRLRSEDGKIFRITKDVVVPGVSSVSGTDTPGAVEVEVVADQAGADYNIGATSFKIPGFEGGPKYDKFSAKSNDAMIGGASDGSSSKAVSEQDIANAKKEVEGLIKSKIKEKVASESEQADVVLDEAMEIAVLKSSAEAKIGEVKDNFNYTVKVHFKAAVFSSEDVKKVTQGMYESQNDGKNKGEIKEINLDYAAVTPKFEEKELSMKVHAEVMTRPFFDVEAFKNEILGKNGQQIQEILKKYPQVGNVDIEFFPSLISRVPQYKNRVTIEMVQ
jgi:hypothetical protein